MRRGQYAQGLLASVMLLAGDLVGQASTSIGRGGGGLFASVGVGYGYYDQGCTGSNCYGGGGGTRARRGPTGYATIGLTVASWLRLGVEARAWTGTITDPVTQWSYHRTTSFYGLMASFYPTHSNFWIKLGPGYVLNSIESPSQVGMLTQLNGFAGGSGLGYDLVFGRRVAVIPYVNFFYQFSGGAVGAPYHANVTAQLWQAGVALGLRH